MKNSSKSDHLSFELKWPRRTLTSSSHVRRGRSRGASLRGKQSFYPMSFEPKWQSIWRERRVYQSDLLSAKSPFYNLMMFPYPSAEGLHVGNMYAFTGADIY